MAKKHEPKYVFAYDGKLKRTVIHIVKGDEIVSLITGRRKKYKIRLRGEKK